MDSEHGHLSAYAVGGRGGDLKRDDLVATTRLGTIDISHTDHDRGEGGVERETLPP